MFIFREIWHDFFSCYLLFEIHPFALFQMNYEMQETQFSALAIVVFPKKLTDSFFAILNGKQCNLSFG